MAKNRSKAPRQENSPQEPETGSTPVPFVPLTHVEAFRHLDTDPKRGSVTAHEETVAAACTALIKEAKAAHYLLFTRALEDANLFPYGHRSFEGFRKEQLRAIDTGQAPRSYEWEETAPTYLRVVRVWVGIAEDLPSLATGPDDPRFPDGAFPSVDSAVRRGFPDVDMPVVSNDERYRRWAEEYLAEVHAFMDKFDSDPIALGKQLSNVVDSLARFELGVDVDEQMKRRSRGGSKLIQAVRRLGSGEILEALYRNKAELVRTLKGIILELSEGIGALSQAKIERMAEPLREWRNLTYIALFYAYRNLSGERAVEITATNAGGIARAEQFKDNGRSLLNHYRRFIRDTNGKTERLGGRDARRGDVEKRLRSVKDRLKPWPSAERMASAELQEFLLKG